MQNLQIENAVAEESANDGFGGAIFRLKKIGLIDTKSHCIAAVALH